LRALTRLILESGQEVQLHMHPEWVDEAITPIFPGPRIKRQHMRHYSLEEQSALIRIGIDLLKDAGAPAVNAFRAGSFGFNRSTLTALHQNGIAFDSSYNATLFGPDSGVMPGQSMTVPARCDGVYEYPMTVFRDGTGKLRHVQVTSCSFEEIERLLWQAVEQQRESFVLLFHSFELLNQAKDRPDPIVLKRFHQLCRFLDQHRDTFQTRGFHGLQPRLAATQPPPLTTSLYHTASRIVQQAYRRRYG
jgi:hypothetical protein